tara:strand:+ start:450 stop:887 length:438 start_codon:yes stop_codon:yes gene_type:complete
MRIIRTSGWKQAQYFNDPPSDATEAIRQLIVKTQSNVINKMRKIIYKNMYGGVSKEHREKAEQSAANAAKVLYDRYITSDTQGEVWDDIFGMETALLELTWGSNSVPSEGPVRPWWRRKKDEEPVDAGPDPDALRDQEMEGREIS